MGRTCGDQLTAEEIILLSEQDMAGRDFLVISDTATHTLLDCYLIYCMTDTVFNALTYIGGTAVNLASKGLAGTTISAGTALPFGNVHLSAIDLTSGSIVAYIY